MTRKLKQELRDFLGNKFDPNKPLVESILSTQNLDFIKRIHTLELYNFNRGVFKHSNKFTIPVFQYLVETIRVPIEPAGIKSLIKAHRNDIITWLYENYPERLEPRNGLIAECAKHGNLDGLIYFYHKGFLLNYRTTDYAAENGHTNILNWVYQNCPNKIWARIMMTAVQHLQYNVVEWIQRNVPTYIPNDNYPMNAYNAILYGDYRLLELLYTVCPNMIWVTSYTYYSLARNPERFRWFEEKGLIKHRPA